jgi:hypothetical protein
LSNLVASLIPNGFEAYAKLLHIVEERDGAPNLHWTDVANWGSTPLHPLIQWHQVSLPQFSPAAVAPWHNQGPAEGTLTRDEAVALVGVLSPYTAGQCHFGVWSGYGDHVTPTSSGNEFGAEARQSRTAALPFREYHVFDGPISMASEFTSYSSRFQSPNLWWSIDHSWCVATEVDLQWTYVAGSQEMIDHLLASPLLETWPARSEDMIVLDIADWLNEFINSASGELIQTGAITIELGAGTVELKLEPLDRKNSVVIGRSIRSGSWTGANTRVDPRKSDQLERDVRFAVRRAILSLVRT